MGDSSLRRCSGSSQELRAQMDQNYVIVHAVCSLVSLEMYIHFARGCFDLAVQLYNKKYYQRAYVDFAKFHQFVKDKLPTHHNYDEGRTEGAKVWLAQADESCLQFLEEIVFQLDALLDEKPHPNSQSEFLAAMPEHKADIYVPEWIGVDSHGEENNAESKSILADRNSSKDSHVMHEELQSHPHLELHHVTFSEQLFPATPHPLPHSHSMPELPIDNPKHHSALHSESNNRYSHSASQDLALAIQESLICAQSPHVDAYIHAHKQQHTHRVLEREHYAQHNCNSDLHEQSDPRAALHHIETHDSNLNFQENSHSARLSTSAECHFERNESVHQHHHHHTTNSFDHSASKNEDTVNPAVLPVLHLHRSTEHSYTATHRSIQLSTSHPYHNVPGLTQNDAAILKHCKVFARFDIPPPTVARHSIYVGNHAHHFEQHDFHLSFAPFLRTLPPELHMSRAAVEVNRCFFIHIGVATQVHPFALQSYFRHTAAAEKSTEEDWEVELARSVSEYAGFVDANVLQYMWPEDFDMYRILLISGPAEDPLLTCFVPQNRNRSVEDLYEIVIRNDRSHFTLLRPLANLTTKIKIIDAMLQDAEQARCVHQVCPVTSKPNRNVGAVIEKV